MLVSRIFKNFQTEARCFELFWAVCPEEFGQPKIIAHNRILSAHVLCNMFIAVNILLFISNRRFESDTTVPGRIISSTWYQINMSNAGLRVDFYNYSCNSCQARKVKCDRKLPSCSTCAKSKLDCQYGGNKKRGRKPKREKLVIHQEVTDLANELNFTKSLAQAWSQTIAEYKNPIASTKFEEGTEIFLKLPSAWKTLLQTYEENYKPLLPGFDHFASNKEIAHLIWNTSLSTPSEFQLLWHNLDVEHLATFVEYLSSYLIGKLFYFVNRKITNYG